MLIFSFVGLNQYVNATNCIDNGDGTSNCSLFGEKVDIQTNYLTDKQKGVE